MYKDKILQSQEVLDSNRLELSKEVSEKFPSKTKFTSLFGATDTVSDDFKFRIDNYGEVYILGISGAYRLIFNGKYWANIIS